jgi:hypothetical protein
MYCNGFQGIMNRFWTTRSRPSTVANAPAEWRRSAPIANANRLEPGRAAGGQSGGDGPLGRVSVLVTLPALWLGSAALTICGVRTGPLCSTGGHGQPGMRTVGVLLHGCLSQRLQNTAVDPVGGHPHLQVSLARPVLQAIMQVWLVPAQGEQVPAYLIGNRAL